MTKPLLDPVVVEDGQGNRGLPDSANTNQSDRGKLFGEIDYLLDQLVASKKRSWRQRRRFSGYARFWCEMTGPSAAYITDLV